MRKKTRFLRQISPQDKHMPCAHLITHNALEERHRRKNISQVGEGRKLALAFPGSSGQYGEPEN